MRQTRLETLQSIANKPIQSLGPKIKLTYMAAAQKQVFPDVFNQRNIPDYELKWAVLNNIVDHATGDAIRRIVDKDYYGTKDLSEWAMQLILQQHQRDPQQWAYYAIKDLADDHRVEHTLEAAASPA